MSTLPVRSAATASTRVPFAPPAKRAVLIGTPETVGAVRDLLALAPGSPEPAGCILLDRRQPRAAGGLPVYGGLDDLDAAAAEHRFAVAIVSLPMAMADAINRVRASLRRLGIEERFIPPVQDLLSQAPPFAVGLATPAAQAPSSVAAPRIDIAELIGRTPHPIDRESVARILAG